MPPPFGRRMTTKGPRRSPGPAAAPEERTEELMDRVQAEKLTRSGHEPQARPLWQQARAGYPDDVWVYVQAGIGYGDIGDHAEALEWLTAGLELALRSGGPEPAVEQLRPSRVLPVRARAPVRRNSGASGPGRTREHR